MASYTRQSSFADGDTITAALFNNEFNQLVNALHNSTGHKHDGTAAEGPVIGLIGDAGETAPNNKVLIDTVNNFVEFYVQVASAPVQQLYIADGAIIPVTDSDIDLGTSSLYFKNAYIDSITTTGNVAVGGNLTVTGTTTFNGGTITMGDAATDNVVFGADVDSNIIPDDDDTYDLGSASQEWRNLYIDGTANIDSLVADTADINAGTIDGATIATSDITVGAGKTLDVSAGTLTLADDQISGDKVEGGTINATTITTLASTTGNITTVNSTTVDSTTLEVTNLKAKDGTAAGSIADTTGVVTLASSVLTTTDINGGTIDGTTIATSDITVGASKTLDVSAGTLTLADNQISGDKVEGGTIAATTITDLTFGSLNDGTITATAFVDEDNMASDSATLIPTQQSVKAYVDSQVTAQDLDFQGDTGGALSIDLDSESLTIAGGTGLDTVGSGNTVTVNIDSTVATLTGSQTLTNKTIDVDNNTVSNIEVDNLKAGVLDTDLSSVAATDTTLASAKAIKTYVDAQITAEDLDLTTDSGTIAIDLDSETLSILGGTGLDSSATGNAVTLAIDSTVATLTGTQTLTNKTIDAASNTLSNIANGSLTNSTVSYGGVSLALGASDATPAFDLTDATNYPTSSLTGTITNAQLAGSIEVSKTLLAGGTGLTLSTNTLSVDAAQTQITSVGTLGSLTVSGDLTIDTSTLVVDSTNNRVGILDATPAVSLDAGSATDAIFVPKGTTAQRPTGVDGYFRYNTDDAQFEGYADGAWGAIAGSGSGSAIEPQIFAGDGSTVNFTLTSAPTSENNLLVFIDGVFQAHDSYSVSGTTLTFSTAPANTRVVTVYHARSNVSGANMIVDTMTGDNSDTTLTLSVAPVSVNNVQVYFDGVYQNKANYSISGTTLTFSTAPATGVAVEAITHTQTTINEPAANTVTPTKIAAGDFYFDTDTLYIDSTNNRVGVGTASPSANLEITQSGNNVGLLVAGGGYNYTAKFESSDAEANIIIEDSNSTNDGNMIGVATNDMYFITNTAERLRIDSSGNVGIGTSSPSQKLTLSNGTFQINGSSSFSSNVEIGRVGGDNNMGFATGGTERMRIDGSGNFLVGTTASYADSHHTIGKNITDDSNDAVLNVVNYDTSAAATNTILAVTANDDSFTGTTAVSFRKSNGQVGSITMSSSQAYFNGTSDYRLKENINYTWDATTRLKQLKPARFNWIDDSTNTTVDGFLAHEVQGVVADAVTGTKDATYSNGNPLYQQMDYSKLVPLLVKTIQELEARITTLENA
jgi:hypothetical protein